MFLFQKFGVKTLYICFECTLNFHAYMSVKLFYDLLFCSKHWDINFPKDFLFPFTLSL